MKRAGMALAVVLAAGGIGQAVACTAVIVGKKASGTGRVIVAHNEDNGGNVFVRHALVPARNYRPGDVMEQEPECAKLPQPGRSCSYFWSEVKCRDKRPPAGDMMLNEHGVIVFSNNGGWQKEWLGEKGTLPDEGEYSKLSEGGVGHNLRRAVAERARTAREGVAIATNLVARYGYTQASRIFTIADKDEAWVVEVIRGRRYVARRCPDDAVLVHPNCLSIREIRPDDIVSANIEPKRAGFDFTAAYQGPRTWKSPYNLYRWKHLYDAVCGTDLPLDDYPFSVVPKRPVTVEMIQAGLRSHYEGTPDAVSRPHGGIAKDRPVPLCRQTTVESFVCAFGATPAETDLAVATGRPCETPYLTCRPFGGLSLPGCVSGGEAISRLNDHSRPLGGMPDLAKARLSDACDAFSTCVFDDVFNRVVAADRACDAKWLSLKTPEAIAAHQREVRAKAIEAMGGFPAPCPLKGRVLGVVERDGYRVEKVIFESRPDFPVSAHLFVPTDPKFKGPFPAVSAPCGHSLDGKLAPWYSNTGVVGAKRGFVVLVYDPVEQGERHQKRDGARSWSTTREHNNIGVRAFLLGGSAAQVRLYDGLRAIDYLASRTDVVDPKKIGVFGISGGGTLSSYINAFGLQVACGSPSGFLSTVRDVFDNCGPQDAEQVIFGQLAYGLNHLGIACLRAPSPILVSASHGDFFPFIGTTDMVEKARAVFAAAGAPDKVDLVSVPGPHHWYGTQKEIQLGWMSEWMEGKKGAYPRDHRAVLLANLGTDYGEGRGGLAYEQPSVKNVTPTGCVLDLPGARSIYDLFRDELAEKRKSRAQLTPAAVRALTGIRPAAELSAREVPAEDGFVLSRDDDGTLIPVVLARPTTTSARPPVLIVSDVRSRTELADEIRGFLSEGRAVALADIRGFGETSQSRHAFYGAKDGDEEIAHCLIALGDSLVARRAEDVALVARQVAKALGARPTLRAEGRAAVPAAHARYLEPGLFAGFETVREPASWESLFADDQLVYPFACTVRGALALYDWTDLR